MIPFCPDRSERRKVIAGLQEIGLSRRVAAEKKSNPRPEPEFEMSVVAKIPKKQERDVHCLRKLLSGWTSA
jgi:hypothetical protein